jgi:phospholipase/lecithinase/hemolysin
MAVDPDTYLFWDDLHPTTRGHNILAIKAGMALAQNEVWDRAGQGGRGLNDSNDDYLVDPAIDPVVAGH